MTLTLAELSTPLTTAALLPLRFTSSLTVNELFTTKPSLLIFAAPGTLKLALAIKVPPPPRLKSPKV